MSDTILILSQVYPPDPASVGQHMHDVAAELVKRGHRVKVITADRGYDDPTIRYERYEKRDGVDVHRVRWSSFGKKSIPIRATAMLIFMLHCIWAGLTTRGLKKILVSTSPPMCGFAAGLAHSLRGVPITYWVMDLNPDQMIELGKMRADSLAARVLNALQRFVLRRSAEIVPLDRFMAERLYKKLSPAEAERVRARVTIMPPWPHEEALDDIPHEKNWFREKHGLNGKFVFMYSGNHGYSTPVTTLLQAGLKMDGEKAAGDAGTLLMFIGGGVGKKEVDQTIKEKSPGNIRSMPYQPFKDLAFSLSAADVHLVTVGNDVVGVVHPCKIYGAMAVGRPILLVAPDPCHASDIIKDHGVGWHIKHGDVEGAVKTLREIAALPPERLQEMGRRAKAYIDQQMSKSALCGAFCTIVEAGITAETRGARRDA
ncbi:MAG: glycosyltransferase family 4 protein [Planctomycetes bacterium]|nr:glycosyltransferase family 4 protein [Planctomycetota bacterium]